MLLLNCNHNFVMNLCQHEKIFTISIEVVICILRIFWYSNTVSNEFTSILYTLDMLNRKLNIIWNQTIKICSDFELIKDTYLSLRDKNRDHFVYAPSQWEMTLLSNIICHWLGTYIMALCYDSDSQKSFLCLLWKQLNLVELLSDYLNKMSSFP